MERKFNTCTVVLLASLIILIGAGLFVDGMIIRFNTGFLETDSVKLLNRIQYSNIKMGNLLSAHAYGTIVFGGYVVFKGIFGVVAAVKQSKTGMRGFTGLTILAILIQAAFSGFWINFRGRTDQWLKGQMLDLLGEYRGPTEGDVISKGWNSLFMEARCCGVVDQFANGDSTGDFQDSQSIWYNTNANSEKVPATCCHGVDDADIGSTINTACTTTPKDYYTEGCYEALRDLVQLHSTLFFCGAGALLIIQLFAILGSCMLIDRGSRVIPKFVSERPPTPIVKGGDSVFRRRF